MRRTLLLRRAAAIKLQVVGDRIQPGITSLHLHALCGHTLIGDRVLEGAKTPRS